MKKSISEEYTEKIKQLKSSIREIESKINSLKTKMSKDKLEIKAYYNIAITDIYLNEVEIYCKMNQLSEKYLNKKNTINLNDARKSYYNALTENEQALDLYGKTPIENLENLQSNKDALENLDKFNPKRILNLMNKFIKMLDLIESEYGPNNKYKWALLDLQSRHAIICKNSINWRKISINDPRDPYFQENVKLSNLAKDLINTVSNRLREKYLLATKVISDIKNAIFYQETLAKITSLMNLEIETNTSKKVIESWKSLLAKEEKLKKEKIENKKSNF